MVKRLHTLILLLALLAGCFASAQAERQDSLLRIYDKAIGSSRSGNDQSQQLKYLLDFIIKAENDPKSYEKELMVAYSYVGYFYNVYRDYNSSLKFAIKSYNLSVKRGDAYYQVVNIPNICDDYMKFQDYASAKKYNEKLLKVGGNNKPVALFNYYFTKGEISRAQNGNDVIGNWQKAFNISKKYLGSSTTANLSNYFADYYKAKSMPDSQLYYLKLTYSYSSGKINPADHINCVKELMHFYIHKGDIANAEKYFDEYFALQDSLMNPEKFIQVNSDYEQKKENKANAKIDSLTFTVSKQKLVIDGVIAFIVIAALLLGIFYRHKMRLYQSYKALYEKNKELMALEDREKSAVARINQQDDSNRDRDTAEVADSEFEELYQRIIGIMESTKEYCSPEFGLTRLTYLAKSNTVYVSKAIKDQTGMSVPSFINEYRIKEARRRMLDKEQYGNYTLASIAESVGYKTQVNFNRVFKKVTGITPSVFLKMADEEQVQQ